MKVLANDKIPDSCIAAGTALDNPDTPGDADKGGLERVTLGAIKTLIKEHDKGNWKGLPSVYLVLKNLSFTSSEHLKRLDRPGLDLTFNNCTFEGQQQWSGLRLRNLSFVQCNFGAAVLEAEEGLEPQVDVLKASLRLQNCQIARFSVRAPLCETGGAVQPPGYENLLDIQAYDCTFEDSVQIEDYSRQPNRPPDPGLCRDRMCFGLEACRVRGDVLVFSEPKSDSAGLHQLIVQTVRSSIRGSLLIQRLRSPEMRVNLALNAEDARVGGELRIRDAQFAAFPPNGEDDLNADKYLRALNLRNARCEVLSLGDLGHEHFHALSKNEVGGTGQPRKLEAVNAYRNRDSLITTAAGKSAEHSVEGFVAERARLITRHYSAADQRKQIWSAFCKLSDDNSLSPTYLTMARAVAAAGDAQTAQDLVRQQNKRAIRDEKKQNNQSSPQNGTKPKPNFFDRIKGKRFIDLGVVLAFSIAFTTAYEPWPFGYLKKLGLLLFLFLLFYAFCVLIWKTVFKAPERSWGDPVLLSPPEVVRLLFVIASILALWAAIPEIPCPLISEIPAVSFDSDAIVASLALFALSVAWMRRRSKEDPETDSERKQFRPSKKINILLRRISYTAMRDGLSPWGVVPLIVAIWLTGTVSFGIAAYLGMMSPDESDVFRADLDILLIEENRDKSGKLSPAGVDAFLNACISDDLSDENTLSFRKDLHQTPIMTFQHACRINWARPQWIAQKDWTAAIGHAVSKSLPDMESKKRTSLAKNMSRLDQSCVCQRLLPPEYSTFSPWIYSLDVVIPLLELRQEDQWSIRIESPPDYVAIDEAKGDITDKTPVHYSTFAARFLGAVEVMLILMGWVMVLVLVGAISSLADINRRSY